MENINSSVYDKAEKIGLLLFKVEIVSLICSNIIVKIIQALKYDVLNDVGIFYVSLLIKAITIYFIALHGNNTYKSKETSQMTVASFFSFLFILVAINSIGIIFWKNILPGTDLLNEGKGQITTILLYMLFVGPFIEGVLYRKIILNELLPNGKLFSIVSSAILFCIIQSNSFTIVINFIIGFALGYVAVKYSFKYSVILHIISNAVALFMSNLNIYMNSILIIFGIFLIIFHYKKGYLFLKENNKEKKKYKDFFTNGWIFIVLISIFYKVIPFIDLLINS